MTASLQQVCKVMYEHGFDYACFLNGNSVEEAFTTRPASDADRRLVANSDLYANFGSYFTCLRPDNYHEPSMYDILHRSSLSYTLEEFKNRDLVFIKSNSLQHVASQEYLRRQILVVNYNQYIIDWDEVVDLFHAAKVDDFTDAFFKRRFVCHTIYIWDFRACTKNPVVFRNRGDFMYEPFAESIIQTCEALPHDIRKSNMRMVKAALWHDTQQSEQHEKLHRTAQNSIPLLQKARHELLTKLPGDPKPYPRRTPTFTNPKLLRRARHHGELLQKLQGDPKTRPPRINGQQAMTRQKFGDEFGGFEPSNATWDDEFPAHDEDDEVHESVRRLQRLNIFDRLPHQNPSQDSYDDDWGAEEIDSFPSDIEHALRPSNGQFGFIDHFKDPADPQIFPD